jgi:hypothetical protein
LARRDRGLQGGRGCDLIMAGQAMTGGPESLTDVLMPRLEGIGWCLPWGRPVAHQALPLSCFPRVPAKRRATKDVV